MSYSIIVSREAHNDIDDIVSYIIHELGNPGAAKSFLKNIEKSYFNIIENPYMYSLCNDKRLRIEGYRKIAIKNYLILYRFDDQKKSVFIVRIVYAGRQYSNLI